MNEFSELLYNRFTIKLNDLIKDLLDQFKS